ncbi:NAD(P)/FAD-dependent oxidoreductase [Altibacter sp. HG106]|uniref:NAD(P)/FAD-dependent oxidoreductase n=1 Tax=Altibacter sp. HG106 TaxID=3023937 RepID=UPI0023510630|nr:FAD-dependent oxidoreductase [Altibacter sp. HG106]MDC7994078.1 FAD-dependent oxidoreductase [Altibacter sp. HG106]
MSKSVVIVGGGIVGLCTAFYLEQEGFQVTLLDQSDMSSGASYVNAGFVSPSHLVPLASPGMVRQGLKWMFNRASPLYIKPRLEKDFLRWARAFQKSCTAAKSAKAVQAIKDLSVKSVELYQELLTLPAFQFHLENKGLLTLCITHKALEKEQQLQQLVQREGLGATMLTKNQVKALEPSVSDAVLGGVHYQCDWHSTPHKVMQQLKTHLKQQGVTILPKQAVVGFKKKGTRILAAQTATSTFEADQFVLAAGSWSRSLAASLGLSLLLEAGKGYRIDVSRRLPITLPAILAESKVAVTPMEHATRFAGTMELSGINTKIRKERVEAIARAVPHYYNAVSVSEAEQAQVACGLRPVTPDGLPYIGRTAAYDNLAIATGHAMMGWSMAPATGAIIAAILSGKKCPFSVASFHPDRSF